MEIDGAETDIRLRIMHGGLFDALMRAVGIRQGAWRAFVLAMLCWCLPLLMTIAQGEGAARPFLGDWGAWSKFLVAPVLLTLAEQPIGFALDECIIVAFRIPLFASNSLDDAYAAVATAKKRSVSRAPEVVCAVIAIAASIANLTRFANGGGPEWAVQATGGLSPAGLWCVLFSNTVYWFLLTRLVWKHVIWTMLLSRFSTCRLRLAITHPDGHGGLGFMGYYPTGYALFSVAVSSVVAAGLGHVMERQAVTPTLFAAACAVWLVVVIAYFTLPLVGLAARIGRLKRKALLLSLAKATDFERETERLLLGDTLFDDPGEESGERRDVKPIYQAALKTSVMIINKGNLLPILLPALLPPLVVGSLFLPYAQLGPMVKRLLLL